MTNSARENNIQMIRCVTEDDYEKFSHFFFRNRKLFADEFKVSDALEVIYMMIRDTNILMYGYHQDKIIAAISYAYGTPENNFEDNQTIFIDCALLDKEFHSSRLFVELFKRTCNQILSEQNEVSEVRFYAYRHHHYIYRLYNKFAKVVDETEDQLGTKDVFSVELDTLTHYLNRFK
ncbi:hypothetical protein [Bacillus massiliigorillae]|uniref:hypothetical protein n=1 Tax=Bacillus massiliigorillae TaxID=1243664 RepID=UPI0003A69630|nr:hypothetical protein [Bacillus massiliigorillae]